MLDRIGQFEVLREIGRGGMGVVYLARDTRLDRDVAIKALPQHLASDPVRLERFEREAKTLAGLSHPNVAGIHGVEEKDGARYLVLEYVPGDTLEERLDRGPLPIDDAIQYAIQIAAGVEAAHEAGVIHRDLKPANIKITPDDVAVVLDFGLARQDEGTSSTSVDPMTATMPQNSPTIAGAILGTAAYMSPEQARGRRVDRRTDIWSFGVVLFEMLTGQSPFRGETASDSIGAVLHKSFDLERLPAGTPPNVRRVLERCLVRDKAQRYRDIGDVRLELLTPSETPAPASASPQRSALSSAGLAALALLCVVLASVALWPHLRSTPPSTTSVVRLTIDPPPSVKPRLSGDLSGPAAVSRDGARVVFAGAREGGTRRLWLRDLSESRSRELDGTDGAMFPFWSPDGRHIGFFTVAELRAYDTLNDTVRKICTVSQGRGAAWTDDGRIILSPRFRGGLFVVDADGGEPEALTTVDEELHTSHRWPCVIPGTDRFVYIAVSSRSGEAENNGIYLAGLSGDAPPKRVLSSDYSASVAGGHLLFVRDDALLAAPIDTETGALTGDPSLIARDIDPDLTTWHGQFSVSDSGVLVFGSRTASDARGTGSISEGYSWDMPFDRISSFDYDGRATTAYAVDTQIRGMDISRDGTMIAFETLGEDGLLDIWLHPTAYTPNLLEDAPDPKIVDAAILNPQPRRFTSLPGAEIAPVFSPDGTEIAFRWDGDETRPRGIYRKRIGDGTVTLVRDTLGEEDYPTDWTPDGAHLIVVTDTQVVSRKNDIYALPVSGGEMVPLVVEHGIDVLPEVSPDGRWLAYTNIVGDRREVRVIPFAPAWPEHLHDRRWVVSQGGGVQPHWSPEGDQLFYLDYDARLWAVDVETTSESVQFSTPREMFDTPWTLGATFGVLPEGQGRDNHFLFTDQTYGNETAISVVLNWQRLLVDE